MLHANFTSEKKKQNLNSEVFFILYKFTSMQKNVKFYMNKI